jgi:hypothetical protein
MILTRFLAVVTLENLETVFVPNASLFDKGLEADMFRIYLTIQLIYLSEICKHWKITLFSTHLGYKAVAFVPHA